MDSNSLSHTKWNCKYHIVFAPKYRRKVAYGKIKQDIANILSMLCKRKGVKIVEAEICPDHVHMLVEIPPSISVSYFVGYLKGKSTLMIFVRHANLKYKYGNRHFWCRGYYVDTVGKNAKKIQEYIANQLQSDLEYDQMTLKEYIDPFTEKCTNSTTWLPFSRSISYAGKRISPQPKVGYSCLIFSSENVEFPSKAYGDISRIAYSKRWLKSSLCVRRFP